MSGRPSLFIVGVMKGGTTALAQALGNHSKIFMCDPKEPQFFMEKAHFYDDHYSLEEYLSFFDSSLEGQLLAEASTWYLYDPDSAKLISAFNPDAKIIVVLREPVERAFSHWQYLRMYDRCAHETFEQAIAEERSKLGRGETVLKEPYISMGKYSERLEPYLAHFPMKNLHVILFDEMKKKPKETLEVLQQWLGVPIEDLTIEKGVNSSGIPKSKLVHSLFHKYKGLRKFLKTFVPVKGVRDSIRKKLNSANLVRTSISPETELDLKKEFESDISSLEKMIGRDLSHWK